MTINNQQSNSGLYKVKEVNSGVETEHYLSIAPENIYWSKTATNSNWNDVNNWVDANGSKVYAVPYDCSNVYLPAADATTGIIYPHLKAADQGGTDYVTYNLGQANAKNLILANRAMLGSVDRLKYQSVSVYLRLKPTELNRWVSFSAPLRNLYVADFLAKEIEGTPSVENPSLATPIDRSAYLSYFELQDPDYVTANVKVNEFTLPIKKLDEPVYSEKPFLWFVDTYAAGDNDRFMFPGTVETYKYSNILPIANTVTYSVPSPPVLDRTNKGRFAYERAITDTGDYNTFTLTYESASDYVLISNPYPSYLNLREFLYTNRNVLNEEEYMIWNGQSDFITQARSADEKNIVAKINTAAPMDRIIVGQEVSVPPFQSFFVKRKTGTSGTIRLEYKGDDMTLVKAEVGGYTFK